MNYEHHTVNHRVGFVNLENQTIERRWRDVKSVVKRRDKQIKVSRLVIIEVKKIVESQNLVCRKV